VDNEAFILLAEWCQTNQPDLAPLFNMVLAYRRWGKVLSTYVDGYAKHINSTTGRTLPDLLPLTTGTGHFAAWNPNPQNQPRTDGDDMASTTSSPRLTDGR
jgi:DNA polymerase I-like protein with 3'-5' exonuclease and polymerase domains